MPSEPTDPSTPVDARPVRGPAWDAAALRSPHAQPDKARRVEAMFDSIARTYERVNRVSTFGLDAGWRRQAVRAAGARPGDTVLDVCCGTGDMAREFASAEPALARILAVDFSAGMLEQAELSGSPAPVDRIRADALRLPMRSGCVDVISCAFGVRNFQDIAGGIMELARVARPGARIVILEFSVPRNPLLRWGFKLYCGAILPFLGRWLARDRSGAYRYLPRSIDTFTSSEAILEYLCAAGFNDLSVRRMNLGGVSLYRGVRG